MGVKQGKGTLFTASRRLKKKGKLILEVISRDLLQHHGRVKTAWLKGAALIAVMASRSTAQRILGRGLNPEKRHSDQPVVTSLIRKDSPRLIRHYTCRVHFAASETSPGGFC